MEEEQGGSETKMVETGVQSIGRLAAAAAKGSSAATAAALGAAGPKLLQSSSTEREQRGRETGMVGIGVRSIERLVPSITVIQFNCTHCPNLMGLQRELQLFQLSFCHKLWMFLFYLLVLGAAFLTSVPSII